MNIWMLFFFFYFYFGGGLVPTANGIHFPLRGSWLHPKKQLNGMDSLLVILHVHA
jgi:hypothetical protein